MTTIVLDLEKQILYADKQVTTVCPDGVVVAKMCNKILYAGSDCVVAGSGHSDLVSDFVARLSEGRGLTPYAKPEASADLFVICNNPALVSLRTLNGRKTTMFGSLRECSTSDTLLSLATDGRWHFLGSGAEYAKTLIHADILPDRERFWKLLSELDPYTSIEHDVHTF